MSASQSQEDEPVAWYIGQHERHRKYHVTRNVLQTAQDQNYDMLTARITNGSYSARVLSQLTASMQSSAETSAMDINSGELSSTAPAIRPLTLSDTSLSPDDAASQLLLLTSPWIDLASQDPLIADVSRQVLIQEISFAAFCGATNIIIRGPMTVGDCSYSDDNVTQFAHAVEEALTLGIYLNIQILFPMGSQPDDDVEHDLGHLSNFARGQHENRSRLTNTTEPLGSWDAWNIIRSVCRYSSRLSVALSLPKRLPPTSVQDRWFSEPLRLLEIPAATFLLNNPGHHVLPSVHQQLLYRYMRLRNPPWILLSDVEPISDTTDSSTTGSSETLTNSSMILSKFDPTPAQAAKQSPGSRNRKPANVPEPHINYIRYLQRRQPRRPPIERFGAGYQDYLQNPLQPLTDNLESITYEVFEKDPVKYEWYERAIAQALRDWVAEGKYPSGPGGRIVVAVAGAGRGPLVTRALRASEKTGIEIDMWAVEKNPNAFVLLQRHNIDDWDDKVSLVHSDMRSWTGPVGDMSSSAGHDKSDATQPPHPSASDSTSSSASDPDDTSSLGSTTNPPQKQPYTIDILVSELLGSFADNELSPECLDGAQHLLNPLHGLSIPTSYTAHLTPVAAPKLHADIAGRAHNDPDAAEIPYVALLQAVDYLSTEDVVQSTGVATSLPVIKQVWEFTHPVPHRTLLQMERAGVGSTAANRHNARAAKMTFACRQRGVCHGLAGYFESVLYASTSYGTDDEEEDREGHRIVELSTNPLTIDAKSRDMISWFPIYFPLETPLQIPDNSELDISMWRRTDGRKVWYEWLVESFMVVPQSTQIEGVEAQKKRTRVGMSKLHSSEKNACLM